MKALSRALNALYSAVEVVSNALMVALFIIVALGVLSRYVFAQPFFWTEELALFTLAWMVFLAGSLAIRRWDHLRVTYFMEKLPPSAAKAIDLATRLLVAAFLIYALVIAARVIPQVAPTEIAPALNINMVVPQLSLIVGLALMSIQAVGVILESLLGGRRPRRQP